jgi:hypothetical protein
MLGNLAAKLAAKIFQKVVAKQVAKSVAVKALNQATKSGKPISNAMKAAAELGKRDAYARALKLSPKIRDLKAATPRNVKPSLTKAFRPIKQARDAVNAAKSVSAGTAARGLHRQQMIDIAKQVTPKADLAKVLKDLRENGTITSAMATRYIAGDPKGLGLKSISTAAGVAWKASTAADKAVLTAALLATTTAVFLADKGNKKWDNRTNIDADDYKNTKVTLDADGKKLTPKETLDKIKRESLDQKKRDAKDIKADKKKADQAKADKQIALNELEVENLKLADDRQRDQNNADQTAHRDDTQAGLDQLKAERDDALANAPKGTKSAIRKDFADKARAYKAQRKAELAQLKAEGKAKLAAVKKAASDKIKILNDQSNRLSNVGFFTDKNGKVRPISA